MSLPKQLLLSFDVLSKTSYDVLTKEIVDAFVDTLNRAIPFPSGGVAYAIYRFNRTHYLTDKTRFLTCIKDHHPYSSMILWADYQDILEFFGLKGKMFLGWNKITGRYHGHVSSKTSPVIAPVQILKQTEQAPLPLEDKILKPTEQAPLPVESVNAGVIDSYDNDMERLYAHMQNRLYAVTQQENKHSD